MLLMERSAERYPQITATMMEFLKYSVDRYFPPLKDYMARCVACGMRVLLNKGVIRSLVPIYHCPSTEPATRDFMQALFSEFLVEGNSATNSATTTPVVTSLPASVPMQSTESIKSQPSTPKVVDQHHDDEDVDAFLYGNSEDEQMAEPMVPAIEEKEELVREPSAAPSSVVMGEEAPMVDTTVDQEQEEAEEEEEVDEDTDEGQSHQSYWIFGDSLKRFKAACIAVTAAQKEMDQDEYAVQILIAKRSLKDILAVFLRMVNKKACTLTIFLLNSRAYRLFLQKLWDPPLDLIFEI
jgi:integrator complex subunit 3